MASGRVLIAHPGAQPDSVESQCQAIVLAPDVVSYYTAVVDGHPRWYTVPLSRVIRISWDDDPFAAPEPPRCPMSGTSPRRDEYKGRMGGYWDGGFYWCPCGAIVEWVGKPGEDGASISEHAVGPIDRRFDQSAGDEIDYLRQFIANLSPDELEASVESLIGEGGQDKLGEWIKTALMRMVEA